MKERVDRLRQLYGGRAEQPGALAEAWQLYCTNPRAPDPEWHLYGALVAWADRRLYDARAAIERALGRVGPLEVEAKTQFLAGVILREIGEVRNALHLFDMALSLLDGLPHLKPLLLGACHYNRALALSTSNRQDEALAGYEAAAAEFRSEGLQDHLVAALLNLSWSAAECGQVARAQTALDEAWPLCAGGNRIWARQLHQAHINCRNGDYSTALQVCERLHSDPDCPVDVQCLAAVVAAWVGMEQQLWDAAETMAKVAVDLACRAGSGDHRLLSRASRTLTMIRNRQRGERGA